MRPFKIRRQERRYARSGPGYRPIWALCFRLPPRALLNFTRTVATVGPCRWLFHAAGRVEIERCPQRAVVVDHGGLVAPEHRVRLRARLQPGLDGAPDRKILTGYDIEHELHVLFPMSGFWPLADIRRPEQVQPDYRNKLPPQSLPLRAPNWSARHA